MAELHSVDKSANDPDRIAVDHPGAEVKADDQEAGNIAIDDIVKDESKPTEDAQAGVQKIEAVTLSWSKASVFITLVL